MELKCEVILFKHCYYQLKIFFTFFFSAGKTSTSNHLFFACQILFLGEGCGNGKYSGKYFL